jgi:predicted nuclease with TOPRIM domain
MSDETIETFTSSGGRKLFLRRSGASRIGIGKASAPGIAPDDNLVLRQLKSMREENKVILERQIRDQQLIVRLTERMEQGFDNIRSELRELRSEVKDLRSDLVLLDNKILNGQNAILDVVRRLDEAEDGFELFEAEPLTEAETGVPVAERGD